MSLIRRTTAALTVTAVGMAAAVALAPLAGATSDSSSAGSSTEGTTSLAQVLAADGAAYDHDWYDYDILDAAVTAVLNAKPESPVKVLADGSVPLTAFLPSDIAFRRLVTDLTGSAPADESAVFGAAATLGIDTIENVLLYHVVPGATITSSQALEADGAELETALPESTFEVDVLSKTRPSVRLLDADPNNRNAYLVVGKLDINKGNKQIAHGITRVLLPVDL